MKSQLYLVFFLSLSGCSKSTYPKFPKGIPNGTNKIYVEVKASPDSLYTHIAKSMGDHRWLVGGSREAMQIQGDSKNMERGVYLKPLIKIKSISPDSSSALFMATWSNRPIYQDYINYGIMIVKNRTKRVTWRGPHEKDSEVFLYLNNMANRIPNSKIVYSK